MGWDQCTNCVMPNSTQASQLTMAQAAILGTYVVVRPCIYVWFIASSLSDILIAIAMTSLLRRTRWDQGRYSTYVLPRVVQLTIETNTLTASVAIISFVVYIAFPNDIYFTFPTGVIEKLYSNTLFLTLNNRIYFRDHPPPTISGDSAYLSSTRHPPASPLHFSQTRPSQSMTTSHTSVDHGTFLPTLAEDPEKVISDAVTIVSEPRFVSHPQCSRCSKTSLPWQVGQRY
ncbi:hypothetical protein BC826DRAFT_586736 [Russula brevipes]|nr:hypothetical protein BC826DRAFT_586736 [Russula brevipes]